MTTSSTTSITSATALDEAIAATTTHDRTLVVDFTAEWCPPCRALEPILHDLAAELADTHDVVTVDVDARPELAARFRVLGFPTLLLFRDGEVVHRLVGCKGKAHLREELSR
jgi:thioredoxin 1